MSPFLEGDMCLPIELENGDTAIVMQMYDDDGEETIYPIRASVIVAQIITGEDSGKWLSLPVDVQWAPEIRYH